MVLYTLLVSMTQGFAGEIWLQIHEKLKKQSDFRLESLQNVFAENMDVFHNPETQEDVEVVSAETFESLLTRELQLDLAPEKIETIMNLFGWEITSD